MRNITAINDDILKIENKIKSHNEDINNSRYKNVSCEVGRGVFLFVLFVFVPLFFYLKFLLSRIGGFFNVVFTIILILAVLVIIDFVVGFFDSKLAHKAALNYLVLWGMMLLFCIQSIAVYLKAARAADVADRWPFSMLNKPNLFMDFSSKFPVFFVNDTKNLLCIRIWFSSVALMAIPVLLLFISSLTQFVRETKKRLECKAKINDLNKKIEADKAEKKSLKEEAAETRKAGEKLYGEEMTKEEPDKNVLMKAADYGCFDAALLVARNLSQELYDSKDSLSKSEIVSYAEKAKKYIDLAEKCKDRDLYTVLDIWINAYVNHQNNAAYSKSNDTLRALKKDRDYIGGYRNNKSASISILAQDANAKLDLAYGKAEQTIKKREEKEREERAEARRRKEEEERKIWYSGLSFDSSYSSGGALTDSQLQSYHNSKCGGLWNPGVIDSDPTLTASQKEQLKTYNRIHGD